MNKTNENCLLRQEKVTELLNVSQIFNEQNYYRIPTYQRGYAWGSSIEKSKSQFRDLWEDILCIFRNGSNYNKHYAGMLALREMDDETKKEENLVSKNAFDIVDGQQRLTSIVIILESIRHFLNRCGFPESSFFVVDETLSVYRFDYSKNRKSDEKKFFGDRIFKNTPLLIKQANLYLRDINDAKEFIDEELKRFSIEEIKQIRDIILYKLMFNIYFVTDDFDVRVTFETMNNRGKKLSNMELLKNRLMYLTSFVRGHESDLFDFININWKEIYDNISFVDDGEKDDEYLQAHWNIYKPFKKGRSERYKDELLDDEFSLNGVFNNYIKKQDYNGAKEHIAKYVESLAKYSLAWKIIHNPSLANNLTDDERKYLDKLNRIVSMQYVKPTVMVVCGEDNVSPQQKVLFYDALEKSLFIVRVMGLNGDNTFSDVCTKAYDLSVSEPKEKNDKLDALIKTCKSIEGCFKRERILEAIKKLGQNLNKYSKYGQLFYKWSGIEYVLYEYELSINLKTNNSFKETQWKMVNKKSIEHILPQNSSNSYWRLATEDIKDEGELKRLKNSIGNLLLLSRKENSTIKNHSFNTKKSSSIDSKSYSYMYGNRSEQKVAGYDVWTPFEIHNREKELLEFIWNNWIKETNCGLSFDDFLKAAVDAKLTTKEYKQLSKSKIKQLTNYDNSNERVPAVVENTNASAKEFESKIKPYFGFKTTAKLSWVKKPEPKTYYFKFGKDWKSVLIQIDDDLFEMTYFESTNQFQVKKYKESYNYDSNYEDKPEIKDFIDTFNRILLLEYGLATSMIKYEETKIGNTFVRNAIDEQTYADNIQFSFEKMTFTYNNLISLIKEKIPTIRFVFTNESVELRNATTNIFFGEIRVHKNKINVHFKKSEKQYDDINIKDAGIFKFIEVNEETNLEHVVDILASASYLV